MCTHLGRGRLCPRRAHSAREASLAFAGCWGCIVQTERCPHEAGHRSSISPSYCADGTLGLDATLKRSWAPVTPAGAAATVQITVTGPGAQRSQVQVRRARRALGRDSFRICQTEGISRIRIIVNVTAVLVLRNMLVVEEIESSNKRCLGMRTDRTPRAGVQSMVFGCESIFLRRERVSVAVGCEVKGPRT